MAYTVKKGDTLWQIAQQLLGDGSRWKELFVGGTSAGSTDPTKLQIGAQIFTPEEGPSGGGGDGGESTAVEVDDGTTQVATTGDVAGSGKKLSPADDDVLSAETQTKIGVGGRGQDAETSLTILTGNEMIWSFDPSTGLWYVSYKMPNSRNRMLFEAEADQMDALFGTGIRPTAYQAMPSGLSGLLQAQGNLFAGNIAEMEGAGTFESEVARVTALALDNGLLPEWAQGESGAMDIIYIAQAEGKSFDWIVNSLSKLPSFNARFPGITAFMSSGNLTLMDAITGFLDFEAGAKKALTAAGFDSSLISPQAVSSLLNKGYSLEVFNDTVSTFKRMQDNSDAMSAFNSVLAASGMNTISSIQDYYNFVKGNAPAEVYDVYESSSIREAAVSAGLGDIFSAADAINAAMKTEQTLQSAFSGMRQAAQFLLRLRNEVDVGKFDLDHEELIDISLGMAPRSGRTEAEVQESISRAVLTAQGFLRKRATPFTGFTPSGTPQQVSLSNLRQSS